MTSLCMAGTQLCFRVTRALTHNDMKCRNTFLHSFTAPSTVSWLLCQHTRFRLNLNSITLLWSTYMIDRSITLVQQGSLKESQSFHESVLCGASPAAYLLTNLCCSPLSLCTRTALCKSSSLTDTWDHIKANRRRSCDQNCPQKFWLCSLV